VRPAKNRVPAVILTALLVGSSASAEPAGSPAELQQKLASNLRRAFAHCPEMTVSGGAVLELNLPRMCRFADGRSASGLLKLRLSPIGPVDAPTRRAIQRFTIAAAPFTLDELQFDGVLLEGELDDRETLKWVKRSSPLKVRKLAPAEVGAGTWQALGCGCAPTRSAARSNRECGEGCLQGHRWDAERAPRACPGSGASRDRRGMEDSPRAGGALGLVCSRTGGRRDALTSSWRWPPMLARVEPCCDGRSPATTAGARPRVGARGQR
jgi:hypothetical protein